MTRASPPTSRHVDVEGVAIHAVRSGADPAATERRPVVLLHGFTGCSESLSAIAERLGAARPVLAIDLVGHGRSDAPADVASYRMERCIAQVRGVWDAFGVEQPHLLGYSMGGRAALSLAAADPRAVRSLLLVGASAGLADPGARAERVRADEALADRIEREGVAAFVDRWMALPLFASQARLGAAALARARAQRLANRPVGLANSLRGMGTGAQPPVHDLLAAVDRPVCLVVGEEDAKFGAIAHALAGRLPEAELQPIAAAGHAAHLENPDAFARVAEAFFAAHDAAPSSRRAGAAGQPATPQPGRRPAASTRGTHP